MTIESVKDEARRLVERLPSDATWEDLQYQIYFRQAVEAGLNDSKQGRVAPLEEARRQFGFGAPLRLHASVGIQ
jgi:predicted transcriptional regulator